jgi:polygalacturonase
VRGDGITDDSAAFQAAINAVYDSGSSGGGVVNVPAGNYAFYTNTVVPSGVTLHGDWTD